MENNMRMNGISMFAAGAVVGGAVGAITALLTAPRSGPTTRLLLAARGREWREKAGDMGLAARHRVTSATSAGRNAASRLRPGNDH